MTIIRSASVAASRPPFQRHQEQHVLARDCSRGMLLPVDSMRMAYRSSRSSLLPQDRSRTHSEPRSSSFPNPQLERVHSWPKATPSKTRTRGLLLPIPHVVDELDRVLGPGDVLVSKSVGNVMQVGTMGGYFGHVMLVTGTTRRILKGSPQAFDYQSVWPDDVDVLWAVPFVECTREVHGLHKAVLLVRVDTNDGRIIAVAEECPASEELCLCEGDEIEAFQSPSDLRQLINSCEHRADLLSEVLAEMMKDMRHSKWSELTAVKAALMSSALDRNYEGMKALQKVHESWDESPICTTVVIAFWQRYLCKLAPYVHFGHSQEATKRAVDLIHRWMPIRADRSLPGDLVKVMEETGWIKCKPLARMVSL